MRIIAFKHENAIYTALSQIISLLRKGKSAEKRNSKAKIHSITITDSKFEP